MIIALAALVVALFSTTVVPAVECAVPTSACLVEVPTTTERYNLWPLRDDEKNYRVETPDFTFILNVCGSVVDSDPDIRDGCRKDAAGCQINKANGKRFDLGDPSDTAIKLLGPNFLQLNYVGGDACGKNQTRTMRILFNCDPQATNAGPVFVSKSTVGCDFLFQWNTKYACPTVANSPPPTVPIGPENCKFKDTDSDKHWDLSQLARANTDWYVVSSTTPQRFYLNICRDVQDASSTEKGSGAVIEEVTADSAPKFRSLGLESSHKIVPQQDDKGLLYRMDGGYMCREGEPVRASVNIRIFCDESAGDGVPVFVGSNYDCAYEFAWRSKYGCPIIPPQTSCQLAVNGGKDSADLSPLRLGDGNYIVPLEDANANRKVLMNMCGPLVPQSDRRCESSSMCVISDLDPNWWKNLGSVGDLRDTSAGVTLRYEDGDFCDDNRRITSTVHFTCDPAATNSQPKLVLVSNGRCDYMFEWKTAAVCPSKVSVAMVLFLVLLSVVVLYFGLGVAYKRFRLGYRGLDQVPHIDFWLKVWDILRCRREPEYSIRL